MLKILVISASWSRESMIMRPKWQEVINQTQVPIEHFDFDQSPDVVSKYRIQNASLPVCILLDQDDNELIRFNGEVDVNKIVESMRHFDPSLAQKVEPIAQLPVTPKPLVNPQSTNKNIASSNTASAVKKLWAKWRGKN